MVGWLRGSGRRSRVPLGVRVLIAILVTLALGTWGFSSLPELHLNLLQSLYRAVRLYTLDLGESGGGPPSPNWQLWISLVLAAALVTRGVFALVRDRARRRATRHLLSGHVVICGAGVHGNELAAGLSSLHDVVVVDVAADALGMQSPRGHYEWRIVGDCVREETLLMAGAPRASWIVAMTGNDFVNSQIVSAVRGLAEVRRVRDRVQVLVQIEDPSLSRFLEEVDELAPALGTVGEALPVPLVSPFSANAIAAERLLGDVKVRTDDPDKPDGLLAMHGGKAPNLLLAGDHPLLDSIVLAGLRRWRVETLRELEQGSPDRRPPIHISLYGPDAVARLGRLRDRWLPESDMLFIEARDSGPAGEPPPEADEWLLKPGRADHAIVACLEELDGVGLTLAISRMLGNGVLMTRVTMQPENVLDLHLERRTQASAHLASTDVVPIAELASDRDEMQLVSGSDRLTKALRDQGLERERAQREADALYRRSDLGVHSDSSWRIIEAERPMLEALLAPVPLSALVAAGLKVNLGKLENLRLAAERLTKGGSPGTFDAWCEYARRLGPASLAAELAVLGDRPHPGDVETLLRLRRHTLGELDALDGIDAEPGRLAGATRIAIFAGAAGSMSPIAARELERLLGRGLLGYDGVILSGGTAVGVPGVTGRVARARGLRIVGYTPPGLADASLYSEIRETTGSHEFSILEPLAMWADILSSGVGVENVRLVVCPGGPISQSELLLARALGARVAWLDPAGETAKPLEDRLPLGTEGVLQLPPDGMSIRAFVTWSKLDDELRDKVARHLHNNYRRHQSGRKSRGDPAMAPWDQLLPTLRDSNRAQANDIPNKLALIGKRLAPAGARLALKEDQIELLAEVEHGRWNIERLSAGWEIGQRDIGRSVAPDLKPWDELSDETRGYDREAVLSMDSALEEVGYGVVDVEAGR
jgi:hypothetical protein